MKRLLLAFFFFTLFISCGTPEKQGNVTITGNIDGLKKGIIYLQRVQDTSLVNIDSVIVDGDANFIMSSTITEPEIHYLYLDKNDGARYNDRFNFFAEKGEINIYTTLQNFENDVRITGGKNQTKYAEYQKMLKRFNDRNLRLMKETYEASKQKDDEKVMANDEAYKKLLKQKYLYTINFAMTNRKLEVAPYITLQEVFDANIKYLDTVAQSLSPKVKKSLYGKQLIKFIEDRKKIKAEERTEEAVKN